MKNTPLRYWPSEKGAPLHCTLETLLRLPTRSVCLEPACRPDTVGLSCHKKKNRKYCEILFPQMQGCPVQTKHTDMVGQYWHERPANRVINKQPKTFPVYLIKIAD